MSPCDSSTFRPARHRSGTPRHLILAVVLLAVGALIGLTAPAASAGQLIPPPDTDPGGGDTGGAGGTSSTGAGTTAAYTNVNCSSIYIDWWQDVESDAKGMWNSAPGWTGCLKVTASGIAESGSYSVKVPYLTTSSSSGSRNGRKDVVAVHGATFDGDGWLPMCKYLLAKYPNNLYRCFAPNLVGMGGSSYPGAHNDWPNGVELGNMTEIEFAGALDAALGGIKAKDGLSTGQWILVGHSNGGLTIQMLQNRLAGQGTHLRDKFGIDKVVMMDSALPHQVCWQYGDDVANHTGDSGYPFTTACDDDEDSTMTWDLFDTITNQLTVDYDAGTFADPEPNYDDDEWVELWWTERGEENNITSSYNASLYGRLPTTDEAYYVANWMGWDSFNEMLGFWPYSRPSVNADIWGGTTTTCASTGQPCTRFTSVSFNKDNYFETADVQNLHKYLTPSAPTCVNADSAYHDCVIVNGTHGAPFSIYATAWDAYVSSGYNASKLTTQLDPVFNKLVVS